MSKLSIITAEENPTMARIRTHPGEVLREEFMAPLALRVPATRIGDIIRDEKPRAISADTALRLGRYFGTTPQFWMNLQSAHDLSIAEIKSGAQIEHDVDPRAT
jgi:antitoxin HigA-1